MRELLPSLDTEQAREAKQLAEKAAADVVEISRTEYMTGRDLVRSRSISFDLGGSRWISAAAVDHLSVNQYMYATTRATSLSGQ